LVLPAEVEDLPPLRAVAAEVHSGVPGQLWEQVTLPLVARDGVLVNFCNRAPLLKSEQIVFVHDASVVSAPQGFSLLFQASYRAMYAALRGRTRGIVTVSEYSKQELLHRLG